MENPTNIHAFKQNRTYPRIAAGIITLIVFFVTYNIDQSELVPYASWLTLPVICFLVFTLWIVGREEIQFTETEIIHRWGKKIQHRVLYTDITSVSFQEKEWSTEIVDRPSVRYVLVIEGTNDTVEIDRIGYRRHIKHMLSLMEEQQISLDESITKWKR